MVWIIGSVVNLVIMFWTIRCIRMQEFLLYILLAITVPWLGWMVILLIDKLTKWFRRKGTRKKYPNYLQG